MVTKLWPGLWLSWVTWWECQASRLGSWFLSPLNMVFRGKGTAIRHTVSFRQEALGPWRLLPLCYVISGLFTFNFTELWDPRVMQGTCASLSLVKQKSPPQPWLPSCLRALLHMLVLCAHILHSLCGGGSLWILAITSTLGLPTCVTSEVAPLLYMGISGLLSTVETSRTAMGWPV